MSTRDVPRPRRTDRTRSRRRWLARVVASAVAALLVVALSSYAGHWRWTGFEDNGTLWDWLNLVLLPVTVATLPLWWSTRRRYWALRRLTQSVLAVAAVVLVVCGYLVPWDWTGFPGNTLWDWLKLLLVPFALPFAISVLLTHDAEEREERDEERPDGGG